MLSSSSASLLRLRSSLCSSFRRGLVLQRLTQRASIGVAGPDAADLLQGLITNDVGHLNENNGADDDHDGDTRLPLRPPNRQRSMYAMFLNLQGRVLFDSIVFRDGADDRFVLDCDRSAAAGLFKHLKMYRVRKKVQLTAMWDDHHTWALFRGDDDVEEDMPAFADDVVGSVDPRLERLGWRLILPPDHGLDLPPETDDTADAFTRLRHRLGVSEGAAEIPAGKCFPMEYNADYLHGVSFHKGCYIGQELTARTHHTGVIRKRVVPVALSGDDGVAIDANFANEKGKAVGKLRALSKAGSDVSGLGLLRLEECAKADVITIGNETATFAKPDWWPKAAPKKVPDKSGE